MSNKALVCLNAVLLGVLLAGCADQKQSLRVGSKPFSESMILAEMIAQLAENEGIAVERHIPFGTTAQIMEATKQGIVDVYPEYNGTGLIFLGQAPTSDGDASTEIVQRLFNPLGMEMTGKFGFSNDYAIVMTNERAQELGVDAIGDLADLGVSLTFAVDDDFTKRPADGLPQLLRRYGITGSSVRTFPLGTEGKDQIISALLDGSADVAELFVTDGQIAEYNLVVLEDDLKFFPVYEVAPLVRSEALKTFSGLSGVLGKLSGAITAADMQRMNKAVDLDAQTPASVASAFLGEKGLLPEGAAATRVETLLVAGDPSLGRSSETARALRAIRAGFPGRDLEILNTTDPLAALASGEARVGIVGTEAFYTAGDSGPVAKGSARAFAVLGYKTAHLFARSVGNTSEVIAMKKIATDQAGSGSADRPWNDPGFAGAVRFGGGRPGTEEPGRSDRRSVERRTRRCVQNGGARRSHGRKRHGSRGGQSRRVGPVVAGRAYRPVQLHQTDDDPFGDLSVAVRSGTEREYAIRPRQSRRNVAGGGRGRTRHRGSRQRRADRRRCSRGDRGSVGKHRPHRPRRTGAFSARTNHRGGRHGPAIQTRRLAHQHSDDCIHGLGALCLFPAQSPETHAAG